MIVQTVKNIPSPVMSKNKNVAIYTASTQKLSFIQKA